MERKKSGVAWPFRSNASRNGPFGLCLAPLPHTEPAIPIVLPSHYRLVVKINYSYQIVYIRFVGTRAHYDTIDVTAI